MPFTSKLYPGEVIYDDTTREHEHHDDGLHGRGYRPPMNASPESDARGAGIQPFPDALLIKESDWIPMIQEQEEKRERISDTVDDAGLICKDQSQTSLCWGNSPVHLFEVARVLAGEPAITFAVPSVTGPVNGFQDEGGYGLDAMMQLALHGACPETIDGHIVWPENKIDRDLWTPEKQRIANKYRLILGGLYVLKPRNWKQHVSALLRRMPCTVGLNYWRHQVTDYELVVLDGEVCIRFRNSWGMGWPNPQSRGYGIRRGQKKYADDITAATPAVTAA